MRHRVLLLGFLVLAAPVQAQTPAPAPTPVYFSLPGEDWRTKPLGDAIRAALSRAGFNLMAKPTPDALVISIPGGLGANGHNDKTSYDFTAVFSRGGAKIGESVEGCKADALSDCADQIAADAQSAAGMMR